MNSVRLGFIGIGNMGKAIIKAIVKTGDVPPKAIRAYDIDSTKARDICEEIGARISESPAELVEASDIIFLCVKPDIVAQSLSDIKQSFNNEKTLVTIAVGIPLAFYENILGSDSKVMRTMPNTPALIGEGMTLYCSNKNITENEVDIIVSILSCLGKIEKLDEHLMSEVTALTSSSPAYVYIMIEAMADAAVLSGIKRDMAYRLAAQAVLGAAGMVVETGSHPAILKDNVCSPGGTTIEAVRVLEEKSFRSAIIEAMTACTAKAISINSKFGE